MGIRLTIQAQPVFGGVSCLQIMLRVEALLCIENCVRVCVITRT